MDIYVGIYPTPPPIPCKRTDGTAGSCLIPGNARTQGKTGDWTCQTDSGTYLCCN